MKVDRRSFLGLGLGAVAGVAVSPVGVKLTDDSSIWTQNWPWTPVPVDGEATYESSVCSLCPGSCGISVRKINHRPVKIEGLADYPINDGGACLHGIAGLQYLYGPSRVKTPLRKNGDRFEKISWNDALALVADKLSDLKNGGNTHKLACITDKSDGSVAGLFKRLLNAYGSSNFYTMPSLESHLQATAAAMHGEGTTLGFDLQNSDFVLSFGAGIIEGWGSPVNCFKANASRKKRHATLYQVEPRLSNTAANADNWIPVNPGTEADLALGICAVIIGQNLNTAVSMAGFKGGFNRLVATLEKEYSLSKTAAVTGIDGKVITDLAKKFIKAKMPVAVFGKGKGDGAQSLKEMTAVNMLNCLAGNLNKKGGAFVMNTNAYLEFPMLSLDAAAQKGISKPKVGQGISQMFDAAATSPDPVVDTLFIYNANPCHSLHSPKTVIEAMGKIPFVVSFSSFLDETAQQADIVFPVHTFLEKIEDVPSGAGLAKIVVGLTKPVVEPQFDTRHPGDILISLASALGGSVARNFEWKSYEDCLKSVTPGIWDMLKKDGFAVIADSAPYYDPVVNFSFLSSNPETVKAQGDQDLTLIPVDNMRLISGKVAATPFAVKTVEDTVIKGNDSVVEINPKTAKSFGLKDRGYAVITTPQGSAKVRVHYFEGIMPGVIGMVEGLGHQFNNKYVAGKGVNIKDLIAPVIEPGSGLDAAFGIKAKITKA